jgi:F-type H+-transporting ATPase subunit b
MNIEAQVTLYTVIVFLLLLAVLWRFAWGPLMKALEEREARIAKRIADAEELRRAAEERLKEYERRIAAAKDEAAALIAEGRRDAEEVHGEIMATAAAESAKTLERAKREIQLAKEAAVHDLREQMVQLAAELASRVIKREVKPEDHRRLIEDAVNEVKKTLR